MTSPSQFLSICTPRQIGALLCEAARRKDEILLSSIVDHIQTIPEDERRGDWTDDALHILAKAGQWEMCVDLLRSIPRNSVAWTTRGLWKIAVEQKDSRFVDFLEPLGLAKADIPLPVIVEGNAKDIFGYVLEHHGDQLPTLDDKNRSCAGPLRLCASLGPHQCQHYLQLLRRTNQPQQLVEEKISRIIGLAWSDIFRHNDKDAAHTMASLQLWGPEGPDLVAIFCHSDIGLDLCQDDTTRQLLSRALIVSDRETMSSMSLDGMRLMRQAGLPILEWNDGTGWHAGHVAFSVADRAEEAIAWLLVEKPLLISTPGTDGSLPMEESKGAKDAQNTALALQLAAHHQAGQLQASTPCINRKRPNARL